MRGPERLGCLRGPGSKEATARAPRALCVYICISYPRVCVETAVLTPPLSMEVETLHDYLCTKLLSPGIVLIDSRILTRILERGVVRVSLNT